jgi:NAD(P)-dependent dehydrogenase (short-subunit alcohol dehydrogenase family)
MKKAAIVTGANTGMGKETARELARLGMKVIMACRNLEKGEAARREIIAETGNQDVEVMLLDLASRG